MTTNTYSFAIGDIHGSLAQLRGLIHKCVSYAGDTPPKFIFIGDYIDRGPKSKEVIEFLQHLTQTLPPEAVICLRGNHDQMLIDALQFKDSRKLWLVNGGLQSYGRVAWPQVDWLTDPLLKEHAQWLSTLPLFFEDEWRFYCHAGIRPGVPLDQQTEDDLLWIREDFLDWQALHPKLIVHGHTPVPFKPQVKPNRVNLDTGVGCYGGKLSAAVFTADAAPPIELLFCGLKGASEWT